MKVLTGSSRLVVVALLTVTTLLAACGDNTPAPAATTTAATTTTAAVVTTAAATTAATTAAAVTTAAATTAATTAAVSATTAAAGAACSTCPASYAKIALPDGLLSAAQKGLPATVTGFILEAYGTDDAVDKVALDTDASVVVSGYAFAIPGATKPVKVGDYYSGAYTKTGSPDVLISIVDVSSLPTFLKDTGADAASQQTFTTAVGTKKTIVFIFGGTGLVSSQLGGSSTTAAAGTVAPATTAGTDRSLYSAQC